MKKYNSKGNLIANKKYIIIGVISLIIIVLGFNSISIVESGEVGLRVRMGKITDKILNEGLNFKVPFIENIVKVNIKVEKTELEIESSTKDLQIVNTTVAVNTRINSNSASSLYRTVGNNYTETVLNPAIKESIKTAIAGYSAEEITVKRNEVSKNCLTELQSKVDKYGIVIEDFNLTDFSFSDEYTKAIEEKQVAEQRVNTAKQNLEKAKVEAEQKLVEAKAEADANNLKEKYLTKDILMEKFIEKWDGKLPETYAGEDILGLFNLR